jgi:Xaa-Pro aminopeptidase
MKEFYVMRLDRVQRVMTREETSGILLFNPFNIRYLTGYRPTCVNGASVAVLGQDTEPWLILPETELDLANAKSWFDHIHTYTPSQDEGSSQSTFLNCIQEAIENHNFQSVDIGVELDFISARRFEELKRLLPDAGFKNISRSIAELRMIKDDVEIEKIQRAVQFTEHGLRAAIEFIQPGITEIEVAAEVERTLRKAGATNTGYPTVIASGPRAACPYAPASRREIASDEFVIISVSATNDDYCSSLTRTVMTGKPNKDQLAFYECARDAIIAARNQLNPETLVRDIALSIRRIADDCGFLKCLMHQMGSGIGLQPIELPLISPTNEGLLLPGMVFTIEASLFKPNRGGIRLGDTVAYQKDGNYHTLNQIPLQTV